MDQIKLESKPVLKLVSWLIRKWVKKKYGYNISFQINDLTAKNDNGAPTIHIDTDIRMSKEDFDKLVSKAEEP